MTSMERVMAVVTGAPVDRLPFALVLSMYGAALTQCPLPEYFTSADRYLAGQRTATELLRPDVVFAPFALAHEAQAFGSKISYIPKNPPNVMKPVFRNLDSLAGLKVPDFGSSPSLQYMFKSVELLAREFGNDIPIVAPITSPVDLPAMLMGVDNWLEVLLFQPEKLEEVYAIVLEYFVRYTTALLEHGAHFFVCPVMFVNPRIISFDLARDLVIPLLARAFKQAPAPVIFHHGGNRLSRCMHLLKGLPNVAAYVLDERDTFAEARQIFGEDTAMLGNLSGPHMNKRSVEDVALRVQRLLEDRQGDNRFMFCTSSGDIAWDTPVQNLEAVRDTIMGSGEL